ncbi:MAG: type IX secretion system sortase PorU [Prevotella sp.]|nr:type IX secretion system sortase PorU [Prevotella sp.]
MKRLYRLIYGLALLFLCQEVGAQEFFNLTARQVRIDSLLPVFTFQKILPDHFADSVYTVSIEYPEFIEMSKTDIRRYQQISKEPLPELPIVTQTVGVARKQGVLDVSFVPLVFRDGKYQKLVSFKLKVHSSPKALVRTRGDGEARRYAEHSVLREGTWAKIRIPESGFYQLTDGLVKKAGFSDMNKVKVYGYGGALQPESLTGDYLASTDDLQEVPTCMADGKRIFYGVGPVTWDAPDALVRTRNPYSDYGYYFLTENDEEPLTISSEELVAAYYPSPEDYHTLYEVDDYAWYHGGRNLFDKTPYSIGTPQIYKLTASGTSGTLSVALTCDGNFEATVTVNDSLVGTITQSVRLDSYTTAAESVWDFQLDGILAAVNTVKITQTAGANLRLDYLSLRLDTPKAMPDLSSANLPVPEYVYNIMNQDHHADEPVDMIIIIPTNQQVLAQAERIKTWHEAQDGMQVRIVPADELYNEFSSGTPDATAYRRYLKMFYDQAKSDADIPGYLLLFGDGAWDNRMKSADWSGYDPDDFLLCFESENSFSHVNCYVSDDFFCLLDDEERIQQPSGSTYTYLGKPDVAVGRYPARTAEEAEVLADKTLNYAANKYAGPWQNVICMMGDDGNGNTHMATADKVATLVEKNYAGYHIKKIYWDAYQRTSSSTGYTYPDVTQLIKQQMTNGALMMNYCGHGAPYALSHELVMKLADFESSVSNHLPLWVTASCDIMPFDGQEENIGETVMLNKRGGGVAFFGTTRTVYASYNEQMNYAFTKYVLHPDYTIGEAVRQAKCDLVSQGRDTSPNKLQYTLLGDPALRLACPSQSVVIDSINGQPVSAAVSLSAGSVATVRGHVEQNQVFAHSFNGVLTATVRDAEETIVCKQNDDSGDGAEQPFTYTDRTKILYQGSDSIRDGVFRFTFAIPKDIGYADGNGLMTLFAVDNAKKTMVHGENDSFVLDGSSISENDSIGPSIYCYLNSKSFVNGGNVNTTPYFGADLYDDDGINAAGNSVGHDLELVIDGELAKTYNLNDHFSYDFGDYRSGSVGFTIPELTPGPHRLLFRAWDVLNNSSTSELAFNVVKGGDEGAISVLCTKNPASTSTSFVINHDRSSTEADVVLDVFDMSGRQLWKRVERNVATDGVVVINWDLSVNGGSRLQTGVYIYRIQFNGNGSSASYANKLIILGNN